MRVCPESAIPLQAYAIGIILIITFYYDLFSGDQCRKNQHPMAPVIQLASKRAAVPAMVSKLCTFISNLLSLSDGLPSGSYATVTTKLMAPCLLVPAETTSLTIPLLSLAAAAARCTDLGRICSAIGVTSKQDEEYGIRARGYPDLPGNSNPLWWETPGESAILWASQGILCDGRTFSTGLWISKSLEGVITEGMAGTRHLACMNPSS